MEDGGKGQWLMKGVGSCIIMPSIFNMMLQMQLVIKMHLTDVDSRKKKADIDIYR